MNSQTHRLLQVETLGHNNAYYCEKCKLKSTASKQLTIHILPNILVLHLKRFSFMGTDFWKCFI